MFKMRKGRAFHPSSHTPGEGVSGHKGNPREGEKERESVSGWDDKFKKDNLRTALQKGKKKAGQMKIQIR